MAAIDIIDYLELKHVFGALPDKYKVLDFGCGSGGLVAMFRERGAYAQGVDVTTLWGPEMDGVCHEFLPGYRIPFDDNEFDLVVSTSVMEHVQNKQEAFREIHRVLKSGGYAVHVFPSKYFLPLEPHIKVPLVSWLHPYIPNIYLKIFALLGFRNVHQKNMPWREVSATNAVYMKNGLNYWPRSRYLALLYSIYSESRFDDAFSGCGNGAVARIDRKIKMPFFSMFWRQLASLFRNQLLICKK
jgi:SAM-dependent methyltransferase